MKFSEEDKKTLVQLLKKFDSDPKFRDVALKDPKTALKDFPLSFLKGKEIKVLENTKTDFHLAIPKRPIPEKFKMDKLPPNPKVPQIGLWIAHQIQKGTEFKEKLLSNPEEVLKSQKVNLPKGLKLHIHQNTDSTIYFVLPRRLKEGEQLSEEELELVAGGKGKGGGGGGLLAKGAKGGGGEGGVFSGELENVYGVAGDLIGPEDLLLM